MMVYRHKLIPTWLSSTFELLHVYSCVRFFFCRGGMVQTAEQYEFIHRGLCLFELTLADWSRNFKPMAAANLQQCKKKNERGVFESFTNEVDWSLMSGRQIFKRNYFSSPRTLKRCKWSRVAVQFLSRYWPISSIVIKLLFLYMFSMFMAPASNFRFGSCKRISYFFLLSLVIEPRPVFFAFVCANAVGISSCHDSFNEI